MTVKELMEALQKLDKARENHDVHVQFDGNILDIEDIILGYEGCVDLWAVRDDSDDFE